MGLAIFEETPRGFYPVNSELRPRAGSTFSTLREFRIVLNSTLVVFLFDFLAKAKKIFTRVRFMSHSTPHYN